MTIKWLKGGPQVGNPQGSPDLGNTATLVDETIQLHPENNAMAQCASLQVDPKPMLALTKGNTRSQPAENKKTSSSKLLSDSD
ncbi:hypothetical protein MYU51_000009 [Penicillium brevicompactum]